MRVEDFLAKLKGVRANGDGSWMACCPAHDDSNPSMSVTERGGKILVHCHAGCSAADIVSAVGLEIKDLFEDAKPQTAPGGNSDGGAAEREALGPAKKMADGTTRKRKSGSHGRRECGYTYRGPDGEVLFEVARYVQDNGKKTFMAFHPKADGSGFDFGIHDKKTGALMVKMVAPYRLPQIMAAAKAGRTLVIVEGEKDVQTVEKMGFVATCNPFGAMKWGKDWPENWGEWFKGLKGILIIADNDKPTIKRTVRGKEVEKEFLAGQKHAWDVRRQLVAAGFAGAIKLMVMPAVGDVTPKDVTDWAEARVAAGLAADGEAFKAAMRDAAAWPEAWQFTDDVLAAAQGLRVEVARAEKSARDAVSVDAGELTGRFGRPAPRAPGSRKKYEVDFDTGGGRYVRLEFDYGLDPAQIFAFGFAAVARAYKGQEMPKSVPPRLKCWSVAIWLLMRGSFFWHERFYMDFSMAMFLDRDERECRLMSVTSNEFLAFVGRAARLEDIEPKKGDMAKVMGLVKQIAVDPDYSRGVIPGHSWERRGNVIYISNGDKTICRVAADGCRMVQNGTDGVVFLRGDTLEPWTLLDGDGLDPFANAKVFTGASWMEPHGCMNVRLWVLNLFAGHKTKPMLLITGLAQSGKTRMARAIKEILGTRRRGLPDADPVDIEDNDKGRESFWVAVNSCKVVIYDNLDTKVKWVSNTLQNASTGGSSERRRNYSDDQLVTLQANASIILTSNNPLFSTDGDGGMADRVIGINLARRSFTDEYAVEADIAANRNAYMTWIARTLSKVMADDKPVDDSINRRHPDYGRFSVRIGRAIGDEKAVVAALGSAEADKALLPLRTDVVTREVLAILAANNWTWAGTAGEMSAQIIERQGDDADEKTSTVYSSRRVGKAMNKYIRQMGLLFKMAEPRILQGKTRYEFKGVTALGSSVVGLVDLNATFQQSPMGGACVQVSETNPSNPPNPPYGDLFSRARGSDSYQVVEENNSENDSEGYGDDDLEF